MTTRSSFLRVAGAAGAAALVRLPAAAASPLAVAAIPSDIAGEAYYAADLGFFEKAGLTPKIMPFTNGATIAQAVVSGAADVGYSNCISLATAHQRGLPFTILFPANLHVKSAPTAGLLAVKKTSTIRTAKDLKGKTIAVIGINNIADVATRAWLEKNGADPKSVHFVELPFSEMKAALVAGRVDAASLDVTADPVAGKGDDPLRVIGSTFDAVAERFAPSFWFSTKDWVAKHSSEAKAFIGVMRETALWANAHHAQSAQILAKHTRQTVAGLEAGTRSTYGDRLTADLVQPNIDAAARYGVIKSRFPASELMSPLG